VYFTPSERSRGIQIADLVAYVLNRVDRVSENWDRSRSDLAVQQLYNDHIVPHRVTWRERWPH